VEEVKIIYRGEIIQNIVFLLQENILLFFIDNKTIA